MGYSITTALLFAFSAICNTRVSRGMDQITANLIRLTLSTVILGIVTCIYFPDSFHIYASSILCLSGLIGFGIGALVVMLLVGVFDWISQ